MTKFVLREFADNPNTLHIELGAGCGNFGQKYHSECFLTEKRSKIEMKQICKSYHVNIFSCDAYNIPCNDNRFKKILMCNPYGYGFNDTESGFDLLKEFARVLTNKGMVIVLSTHTNSYAMPKRVLRRIDEFNAVSSTVKFNCQIHNIDCNLSYPTYKFFHVNGTSETSPTNQILLTCSK